MKNVILLCCLFLIVVGCSGSGGGGSGDSPSGVVYAQEGPSYFADCQSEALYCAAAVLPYHPDTYEIVVAYHADEPNLRHAHCRLEIDGEEWWVYMMPLGVKLKKDNPFSGGFDWSQPVSFVSLREFANMVVYWGEEGR